MSALNIALISVAIIFAVILLLLGIRFERRLRMAQPSEQDGLMKKSYGAISYPHPRIMNWKEDAKRDFHPRSWLSRYRRTSVKYVLLMALYFHGVGAAVAYGGTVLIEELEPSYETPVVEISLAEALAAGPLEEPLFFGIPFYASGNAYVVLIAGAVWASLHVLNTELFGLGDLAYGNFLFAFVSLFFSLRTWASGKGWLSIAVHSGWNVIVFSLSCGTGEIPCNYFGTGPNVSLVLGSIIFAEILLFITFLLYRGARRREAAPLAILGGYTGSSGLQAGQRSPSKAWYILPILFHFIGGLIMYFALRRRDEKMAKRGILIGVLVFIATAAIGSFYSFFL